MRIAGYNSRPHTTHTPYLYQVETGRCEAALQRGAASALSIAILVIYC